MEDDDESLLVPEEPPEDEDTTSSYGAESSCPAIKLLKDGSSSFGSFEKKSASFSSIVTAIRVAKWMAKAYGYTSKQKSLFIPQDKVNCKQIEQYH